MGDANALAGVELFHDPEVGSIAVEPADAVGFGRVVGERIVVKVVVVEGNAYVRDAMCKIGRGGADEHIFAEAVCGPDNGIASK